MKNQKSLFETLQENKIVFFISVKGFKGSGTLLKSIDLENSYTYLPEYKNYINLTELEVIEILNTQT